MLRFICLIVNLLLVSALAAQRPAATVVYHRFQHDEANTRLEVFVRFEGAALAFAPVADGATYRADVAVDLQLLNADSLPVFARRYEVHSPELSAPRGDTLYVSLQAPVVAPHGRYTLHLVARDRHRADSLPLLDVQEPVALPPPAGTHFSDIQLLADYHPDTTDASNVRHGMALTPWGSLFYPESEDRVRFFAEIYGVADTLGVGAPYLLTYQILDAATERVVAPYAAFKRREADGVGVLLAEFDVADLPSGNYFLRTTALDPQQRVLAEQQAFFQRSNPRLTTAAVATGRRGLLDLKGTFAADLTLEHLRWFLPALQPIATADEAGVLSHLVGTGRAEQMRDWLYRFWRERDALDPEFGYRDYLERLNIAEKEYATQAMRAHDTDRGRVYLQYGRPSLIEDEYTYRERRSMENGKLRPFEVWRYPRIDNPPQSDRVFVFVQENLGNNNYRLLHSDALGEFRNENWYQLLQQENRNLDFRPYDDRGESNRRQF
ncbi:MAG: GWxTD domain-containing protein [Catalinimonas sp.]